MIRLNRRLAAASVLTLLSTAANADYLPINIPASADAVVQMGYQQDGQAPAGGECSTLPVTCDFQATYTGARPGYVSGSVAITGNSDPSLSVYGVSTNSHVVAYGSLVYYVEVLPRLPGGQNGALVNYTLAGAITIGPTGDNQSASAGVSFSSTSGGTQTQLFSADTAGNFTYSSQLVAGQYYVVSMGAGVNLGAGALKSTFASNATVDPTFTLTGPDAQNYELVYSEGLFYNTPAVPEPSTWAMMVLGFAGIGVVTWRRKPQPRCA